MVSFQHKLAQGLSARGIQVTYSLADPPYQAVLVTGGTRELIGLWRARRKGVPVIQRLDGMNWLHRVRKTGVRHRLRAEYGNAILRIIRSHLADQIVYQSHFCKSWWEGACGPARVPDRVIYNGVDLAKYSPQGPAGRPNDRYRILLVEGSLGGGYEQGLETAVLLVERLHLLHGEPEQAVELVVAGKVSPVLQKLWQQRSGLSLHFTGLLAASQIPELDRSAHLLYSADLNAACPNSVIEALACGLPVLAFNTGALPELVTGDAGRIVAYGGDPWRLEPPDFPALARAGEEILHDQERFRAGARRRAEEAFSLDDMVEAYREVLLGS